MKRILLPAMTFVILAGCGFEHISVAQPEAFEEACRINADASEFSAFELRLGGSKSILRPISEGKVLPFEAPQLEAGKPLRVVFDPADDKSWPQIKTPPSRHTRVFYSVDGEKDAALVLDGETMDFIAGPPLRSSSLLVPESAAKSLALHLEAAPADTDRPAPATFNYIVAARPSATLCFDAQWNAFATAPVRRGSAVRLAYDIVRLCDRLIGTEYNGLPTWSILMHMAVHREDVDSPDLVSMPVKLPQTSVLMPILRIPDDALWIELWFEGTSRAGSVYDSDYGRNFRFDVVY